MAVQSKGSSPCRGADCLQARDARGQRIRNTVLEERLQQMTKLAAHYREQFLQTTAKLRATQHNSAHPCAQGA